MCKSLENDFRQINSRSGNVAIREPDAAPRNVRFSERIHVMDDAYHSHYERNATGRHEDYGIDVEFYKNHFDNSH